MATRRRMRLSDVAAGQAKCAYGKASTGYLDGDGFRLLVYASGVKALQQQDYTMGKNTTIHSGASRPCPQQMREKPHPRVANRSGKATLCLNDVSRKPSVVPQAKRISQL